MLVTVLSVLFVAALAFAVVIFLLSAVAPTRSEKRFWVRIQKLRNGLDAVCYWLFNSLAILAVLYGIWTLLSKAFH